MPDWRDSQSGEPNAWRGKFHYLCQECREISLTLAGRWILSAAINEKLSINQRDHFRYLCHSTNRVDSDGPADDSHSVQLKVTFFHVMRVNMDSATLIMATVAE
jgi:hypothetical protein